MADNRKLAQGLRNLPASAREDLAGREQDIQRGKTVELLRRAGKEMYENPVVNTAIGLSPVLGDIQAGVEAYRSAQEGDWGNAGLNAMGVLPFIPMLGKTVWHGSPHTFDKFDLSKIGTGEGAQAYGHGLYFADAKPVAEEYANLLGKEVRFNNQPLIKSNELVGTTGNSDLDRRLLNNLGDIQATRNDLEHDLRYFSKNKPEVANRVESMINQLDESNIGVENAGSLYKVDLPDEQIAKMLDWDKPLNQQSQEVLQALEQSPQYQHFVGLNEQNQQLFPHPSDFEAKKFYGMIGESPEDASRILREQGIPGIQYLDQASRDPSQRFIARSPQGGESVFNSAQEAQDYIAQMAKHGHEFEYVDPNLTRNYVVFSDEIPQILERNNQPVGMFK